MESCITPSATSIGRKGRLSRGEARASLARARRGRVREPSEGSRCCARFRPAMLEQMRKSSRSLLIMVLFGIVIVVFIVNFGPQSQGTTCEQMNKEDNFAARVGSQTITNNDFRYGFMLMGGAQKPTKAAQQERLKETVMDMLIERELLVETADKLGFVVTEEEVEDEIAESRLTLLGAQRVFPRLQKDGKFNYESFKMFVQFELGMTPKAFLVQQRKELLAARVRNLLREGVNVSDDEVKNEFVRTNRPLSP